MSQLILIQYFNGGQESEIKRVQLVMGLMLFVKIPIVLLTLSIVLGYFYLDLGKVLLWQQYLYLICKINGN